MSKARVASTVPVVGLLLWLAYSAKKKAESVAPAHAMEGLGRFKMKSVSKIVSKPAQIIAKPLQQAAAKNKYTKIALKASVAAVNPLMALKDTKNFIGRAVTGKDKIAHMALIASDPIQQMRAEKKLSARTKNKTKQQPTATPVGATFPYQVEPGIWIDKDGNRVNQDGSAYVDPNASRVDTSGQPPIYYGPQTDQNDPTATDNGTPDPTNPSAPYYVPSMAMWYDPQGDQYYDPKNGQLFDGYLNPINADGSPTAKNTLTPTVPGQESRSYADQPQTDLGPGSIIRDDVQAALPSGMVIDSTTGFVYDYASDTYYDPTTGNYYDGYMNPITDDIAPGVEGAGKLGSLGFHVAKSAYNKAGAIAGAIAAVVVCYYASGGCAPAVGAATAYAAYAWRKSKPNPGPTPAAVQQQAQEQYQRNQEAKQLAGEPYFDTTYNMWYDPQSGEYYDPTSHQVYRPSTQRDANGLAPTNYYAA